MSCSGASGRTSGCGLESSSEDTAAVEAIDEEHGGVDGEVERLNKDETVVFFKLALALSCALEL